MSYPSAWIRPAVGGKIPVITLIKVVLPDPFGPMRPRILPGSNRRLMPSSARSSKNRFETDSTTKPDDAAAEWLMGGFLGLKGGWWAERRLSPPVPVTGVIAAGAP